jgi:hypothetical protein
MTYFHPRDFDYEQPIISELSLYRKFKSYYGLKGSLSKAQRFVGDFDFVSLNHADKLIDWNQADQFNLIDEKLELADFKN